MRAIRRVIKTQLTDMGGVVLDQALPSAGVDQIDPFLLIHHFKDTLPGGQDQRDLGVGPHPHRGFAPVTFIFEGEVHHRDSRGNKGVIGAGGTQWLESGMGIIHSERPSQQLCDTGGDYEIVQFWVNMKAEDKMNQPIYQSISDEETPLIPSSHKGVQAKLVSGNFKGLEGPISTSTGVTSMRMQLEEGGAWQETLPESSNVLFYLLDGQARINGQEIVGKNLVWFGNEGELINIEVIKSGKAILLAGVPLNESMVHYGPFVMNTETQIMEALRDYQMGKMGILIEEFEPRRR